MLIFARCMESLLLVKRYVGKKLGVDDPSLSNGNEGLL